MSKHFYKNELKGLTKRLLERLNTEDQNWIDEAQDRSDTKQIEAEEMLHEWGYEETDPDSVEWDEMVQELASELVWVPGRYELAGVISRAGVRKRGK